MPQPLPSKERSLFTQVVKNYEGKQYKKGLKAAEQILRKVPDHGDTQAMKALIFNSQGHRDEAFALAKTALKNDMKSHVCWHVYGLLYRSDKNFEESIKAYKFALKLEPDSQQIQRDLALLQIQMRDYPGYVQSRRAMLQARPGLRSNWTALAIAQHLSGDLETAERTLTTYEESLRSSPPTTDTEHQEAILYKNTIIAEMNQIERALDHLNAAAKHCSDKNAVLEMKAKYLLKLERKEEAAKVYRVLLDRNAEFRPYYAGLQEALGIENTDVKGLRQMYTEYAEKNARGDAPRRIPLDFLNGEEFREAADQYLRRMLKKGVPSTFANVKALYVETSKRQTIQELAEIYVNSDDSSPADGTDNEAKGGSTLFDTFKYYFLALHYNYHLSRDLTKAMSAIEKALEKNPKSVDYRMTKGRIWKHHGNYQKAAETMEEARALDERDRYINTKTAKYLLRNDENEAALKVMSKFTKPDAAGGPLGDLIDMQSLWFLTEDGESYLRQRRLGLALKRFQTVYNVFEVWQEDQFDFHQFSLRKGQIRAYVDMLRWEDHLRDHPYFTRVAIAAVKAYVLLHDRPHLAHGALANGVNGVNGLSAAEQKKAERKARKEKEKQEQIEAEKKDAKKTAGVGGDGEQKKTDTDPEGKELALTKDPLRDAMKFLTPVLEFSPKSCEVQKWGFEVFFRRGKYLLALRCLLALNSLSSSDPAIHHAVVRLRHALGNLGSPLPATIVEVINAELKPLLSPADPGLEKLNEDFLSEHAGAGHQIAGLQARQFLGKDSQARNVEQLVSLVGKDGTSLEDAMHGLEVVRSWDANPDGYIDAARKRWPEAKAFWAFEGNACADRK